MATILKPDADVAKKEAREQARKEKLDAERIKYLEALRKDGRFKMFVIEEILNPLIENLTDIRNISLDAAPDEVKRTLAASQAARLQLENFRKKIT